MNYEGGSSESVFWRWLVVKPVVSSILASIEVWLKFVRVSGPLYLICDKQSANWSDVWNRFPRFNAHLGYKVLSEISKWITRIEARLVPLQVKDPISRFGESLLQMPRSRPHWSRYIKIGIRAGRIPPSIVFRVIAGCCDALRFMAPRDNSRFHVLL